MLKSEAIDLDESLEPAILRNLNEDQKLRLTEWLDRYLAALEQGEVLDIQSWTSTEPELSDIISKYVEKLNAIYGLAGRRKLERDRFGNVSEEAWDDLPTGGFDRRLGDFLLHSEIGRGGMGIVYEAHQESLNRKVAIKLLPLASMMDERQIARFRNEAHAAGLLQHPNIVPVYSIGCERGIHFYAMQFVSGMSVDKWIEQERQIAWKKIVGWAIQIADALHAAHETGIVHRDVKPSNLMLDRDEKIWITDFGLARCQTEVSLTNSGDLVGTIRYMSPEQAGGRSALIDGRSDVYSLAATVYEMLSRRPVYVGEDAAGILRQIDTHEIVPLRKNCPEVPRDLETVISKALAKSRDSRYETAREFADDLRRVIQGEPTNARPPTRMDLMVRWANKHRRAVMVTILLITVSMLGMAVGTALLATQKRISDENARRSNRNAQLARDAVDDLGTQIAELLSDVPAAEPIRHRLLVRTLGYYERFVASASDDPSLQEDLALTCAKIGTLSSEIGSHDNALQALDKATTLYAKFASTTPLDSESRLAWSTSQNNLGEALHRAGRVEEAAKSFALAVKQQEQLLQHRLRSSSPWKKHQGIQDAALRLSTSKNNLGLLLSQVGAVDRAQTMYRSALELLTTESTGSSTAEMQQQLATVRTNLSGLLLQTDPVQALQMARDALDSQSVELEIDPGNARLAAQTVISLNALGMAQAANQSVEAAITSFRNAIHIEEQLLQRAPNHPTYRRDLVLSLNHLGLAFSRQGRLQEARDEFKRAKSCQESVIKDFPNDAESQSILGGVLNNLGFLEQQLGNRGAAIEAFRAALVAQRHAIELAPQVSRYAVYLEKHIHNLKLLENNETAI